MSIKGESPSAERFNPVAGQQLKNQGMTEADENVDPAWAERCDAAIEEMARRKTPFQASDLVKNGLVGEPEKHQQWGARFLKAANAGIIRRLPADRSNRKHTRRSLLHIWIGAL